MSMIGLITGMPVNFSNWLSAERNNIFTDLSYNAFTTDNFKVPIRH